MQARLMLFSWRRRIILLTIFLTAFAADGQVPLVRDSRPAAVVVVDPEAPQVWEFPRGDRQAAEVLVEWIRKITDAELPIVNEVPEDRPAVLIGLAARRAGLRIDDIDSPSNEGLRILTKGDRILLGGQNRIAVMKAVCRLLEEMGCLYAFDHPLGRVHPRSESLTVGPFDLTEKPGFQERRVWGSRWTAHTLYKVWNGAGGHSTGRGHAWDRYVSQELFDDHPEYFALRDGRRRRGNWYCTSNPKLREIFTRGVIAAIDDGVRNPSLSPPDGRGHCECDACTAQDDPASLEVGGLVSKSNRYVDFYEHVAAEVKKVHPQALLGFYAYTDYTLPPTTEQPLDDNLVAWVAPIRYCWWHGIANPDCASRREVKTLYRGWARYVSKFGMRDYNYNFGDCILPFSKVAAWRSDIPFMADIGVIGIDMETLPNWCSYGPGIYVFSRLAYDPSADVDAMLTDYFLKLYGPEAGPHVQEYYHVIDEGVVNLSCDPERGGVGLEDLGRMFTPGMLARLRKLMDRAVAAAADHTLYAKRVDIVNEGLRNAEDYAEVNAALQRGEYRKALNAYERLVYRTERLHADGLANRYAITYLSRFLGHDRNLFQLAVKSPPNTVLAELPDAWKHAWDGDGKGIEKGYAAADQDDGDWEKISTYKTLLTSPADMRNAGYRWFRTTFEAPEDYDRIGLLLARIHREALVFVNGQLVCRPEDHRPGHPEDHLPGWSEAQFDVDGLEAGGSARVLLPDGRWPLMHLVTDVTPAVKPGRNVLAIRRPHAAGHAKTVRRAHRWLTSEPVVVLDMPLNAN